ncbi:MAG: hypothetical protein U9N56_06205, partial [Actinomycetota bacterium]|nr:hypothetical protein [Actinomycetota bacterium]
MGNFDASLKTMGDRKGLPATVRLEGGRIIIEAGDAPIGDWALDEIHLEPIPAGYRMSAEGEQILLELTDVDGFKSELNGKKSKRSKARKKTNKERPEKAPRQKREKAAKEKPEKAPRQK